MIVFRGRHDDNVAMAPAQAGSSNSPAVPQCECQSALKRRSWHLRSGTGERLSVDWALTGRLLLGWVVRARRVQQQQQIPWAHTSDVARIDEPDKARNESLTTVAPDGEPGHTTHTVPGLSACSG